MAPNSPWNLRDVVAKSTEEDIFCSLKQTGTADHRPFTYQLQHVCRIMSKDMHKCDLEIYAHLELHTDGGVHRFIPRRRLLPPTIANHTIQFTQPLGLRKFHNRLCSMCIRSQRTNRTAISRIRRSLHTRV